MLAGLGQQRSECLAQHSAAWVVNATYLQKPNGTSIAKMLPVERMVLESRVTGRGHSTWFDW